MVRSGFSAAPLSNQLGSTQVLLGGDPLPLLFVSENQVNVLVPYESALNTAQSLIVLRGNATSVPVQTAVFGAQPAILATAGNGLGQGHIYRALSSGQVLADASSPAVANDVLVMYAVGLGAVTPSVKTGTAAPSSPLARVAAPVTVTIGGAIRTTGVRRPDAELCVGALPIECHDAFRCGSWKSGSRYCFGWGEEQFAEYHDGGKVTCGYARPLIVEGRFEGFGRARSDFRVLHQQTSAGIPP